MTWPLLVIGILLSLLGLWGGPAPRRKEAREGSRGKGPIAKGDAWQILTQPVISDEELIKLPERRPWYKPGRAGRFQRGLMLGLGIGLLIAAAIQAWAPRSLSSQPLQAAAESPKPAAPAPTKANNPAPTSGTPVGSVVTPPPTAAAAFEVAYGDTVQAIAANLKAKGLIADESAFSARATARGADTMFKAGTFTIPTGASIDQVLDALTR